MTLGLMFPGQGSQSVGMMKALAGEFPSVEKTFAEASQALGEDLWRLVSSGPAEILNETRYTQPAMLAAGVAVWRVWREQNGAVPGIVAGHSLGEYTALVCAEALDFSAGVRLVADRARFMQEAVPAGAGAMAAIIGLDDEAVRKLCREHAQGAVLEAVNFNSPGQVVIAGAAEAVKRAVEGSKIFGAKRALLLPVSVPSHCAMMRPAAERLAQRLAATELRAPRIPVVHNVHAKTESEPDAMRKALAEQVASPVRWVECVQAMTRLGAKRVVECGPGKVLTGLVKRIEGAPQALSAHDPASLREALSLASPN